MFFPAYRRGGELFAEIEIRLDLASDGRAREFRGSSSNGAGSSPRNVHNNDNVELESHPGCGEESHFAFYLAGSPNHVPPNSAKIAQPWGIPLLKLSYSLRVYMRTLPYNYCIVFSIRKWPSTPIYTLRLF